MKCMVIPDQSVDRLGCVDLWEAPVKAANGPSKLSNAFDVKHAQVILRRQVVSCGVLDKFLSSDPMG